MSEQHFVVKARGLPWSCTANEMIKFFNDVDILNGEEGVHFTLNKEGRPSGEAFVELTSQADLDKALTHNNEHIGKRYIEVKEGAYSEMEWVVNRQSTSGQQASVHDGVVRLRGLPYNCSKQDIAEFFTGLQIVPYGITITMDQDGRPTGDAYVEFTTADDAEKALLKHKEKIGHRYIEIFKSAKGDIKQVQGGYNDWSGGNRGPMMGSRPGPYDRPGQGRGGFRGGRGGGGGGGGMGPSGFNSGYEGGMGGGMGRNNVQNSTTGHSIHMRGLPFEAKLQDVLDFHSPLIPVDVRLLYEAGGRPKGECDVDFSSHADAEAAMLKDKSNMGHRYIELFLKSTPTGNSGGWNRGGGNMNRGGMGGPAGNNYGGYGAGPGPNMGGGMAGPMGGGMNQGYGSFSNDGGYGGGAGYGGTGYPNMGGGGNYGY